MKPQLGLSCFLFLLYVSLFCILLSRVVLRFQRRHHQHLFLQGRSVSGLLDLASTIQTDLVALALPSLAESPRPGLPGTILLLLLLRIVERLLQQELTGRIVRRLRLPLNHLNRLLELLPLHHHGPLNVVERPFL